MQTFQYKARDKSGKLVEGVMSAESEQAIAAKLEDMGCIPINISVSREKSSGLTKRSRGIALTELNFFTRQLTTMQKAGIPILRSLTAYQEQTSNVAFKNVIGQIRKNIESGKNLSAAFEGHPAIFSPLYVSMIKAGEISGKMDEILERLAILGEHEEKIQRKVKTALRYPTIVLVTIVAAFFVLISFVIPRFKTLFDQYEAALPLITKILIGLNQFIIHYWWLAFIFLCLGFWGIRKYIRTAIGRNLLDRLKIGMPGIGKLFIDIYMARFCRIMGTLLASGVPLMDILNLVSGTIGNTVISGCIENIKKNVNQGKGMVEPMRASGLFPPTVIQMVAIGEETGKIDELLLHVADYYDEQIEYILGNAISLIEPLLIFVLSIGVLFLALGIFLPMWNIMHIFRH